MRIARFRGRHVLHQLDPVVSEVKLVGEAYFDAWLIVGSES